MRAGLVVYGSLDLLSGGNLYDRMLVEHLVRSGHEVEVISIALRSYGLSLAQNLSPSLKRRLAAGAFDVLLQDELVHPSLFLLNRALRRPSARPLVSIVHHLRSSEERADWQNDLYRRVEERYLLSMDAFVFNSQTTRESVEFLLSRKTRNVVAPPGGDRMPRSVTRDEVRARAASGGELRLLFVGNLIPRKGFHHLLDALALLRDKAWTLEVVGSLEMDPSYVSRVRPRVDELALGSRVRFHGALEGASLEERFRAAHLFVVPSTYEGFGIVYLEAMGFGLPVIACASGATDEIVRHESTGFLVPPGDAGVLANRIEALVEDRVLLTRMSISAYEAFGEHPGWDASMTRIEEFLVELTR